MKILIYSERFQHKLDIFQNVSATLAAVTEELFNFLGSFFRNSNTCTMIPFITRVTATGEIIETRSA